MEEFEQGETLAKPTMCPHTFHRACIEQWLKSDFEKRGQCSCPLCRTEICA
jgi:hypothetical protein